MDFQWKGKLLTKYIERLRVSLGTELSSFCLVVK